MTVSFFQKTPSNKSKPILFVPPMDKPGAEIMASVFRAIGYDARVLIENAETLAVGLSHTSGGECAPCPSTIGALIAAVQKDKLPPEQVILFMPTACGPCRFGQYTHLTRRIVDKLGWEKLRIMSPSAKNAYSGLTATTRVQLWKGVMVADLMRKMLLRIRPYEQETGAADNVMNHYLGLITNAVETKQWRLVPKHLKQAADAFASLPVRNEQRPLVAVVGEIYVRLNHFLNGDVCRRIEDLGGEAAMAPISEWVLYTNHLQRIEAKDSHRGFEGLLERLRLAAEAEFIFHWYERRFAALTDRVLADRHEPHISEVMNEGMKYLPWQFQGESILTLGRTALFVKREKARAVVNASPMFCMPGTITTSLFTKIENELNVPVICNFYDGSGDGNQSLVPVMHYLCSETKQRHTG
jgi:predicted nucleotide-binding protein (sugar kinase/HSP70/actin superfamily)